MSSDVFSHSIFRDRLASDAWQFTHRESNGSDNATNKKKADRKFIQFYTTSRDDDISWDGKKVNGRDDTKREKNQQRKQLTQIKNSTLSLRAFVSKLFPHLPDRQEDEKFLEEKEKKIFPRQDREKRKLKLWTQKIYSVSGGKVSVDLWWGRGTQQFDIE